MNYIIFDLEATCGKTKEDAPGEQEIIEIGALKLDDAGQVVSEFQSFVKPKNLAVHEDAPEFNKAIRKFREWIGLFDEFLICVWGEDIISQLTDQMGNNKIEHEEWLPKHIDLQDQYRIIKGNMEYPEINDVLKKEKILIEGKDQREIEIAKGLAKIFERYLKKWNIIRPIYKTGAVKGFRVRMRYEYYYSGVYFTADNNYFLYHIREYLYGNRSVPVFRTGTMYSSDQVYFTFSNELLEIFIKDIKKIKKPCEAAVKYGFRGFSKGGQNGIFLVRKQDKGLLGSFDGLIQRNMANMTEDLQIEPDYNIENLRKVKIVSHNTAGKRIIGLYNTENNRMYFLDFAEY